MSRHLAPIDRRPPQRTTSLAREWRDLASRAVHPSVRPLGIDNLTAIAKGLASVTVPFERRLEVPSQRHHELILATPVYEAWVICWPQGGRLELHDHGPSAGSFCVVGGTLDESVVVDGCLHTRHLGVGESATFGPGYRDDVLNRHAVPATSVHVYSPPLTAMTFDQQTVTGELVPTRAQRYDRPGTPPHHVARLNDAFLGDRANPTSPIEGRGQPA